MRLTARHIVPLTLALMIGGPAAWIVFFRTDVVTYTGFRLEPAVIQSAQQANLIMSVEWHRTGCRLTIQQKVWSIDGTQTFSVDGPYIATMKDERRVLVDKPRPIVMPALSPGEYETGFSQVDGKCWPWEGMFPIRNTPPKRFRFAVK